MPGAQAILLSSAPLVFATSISVSDAIETSLTVSLAFPGGTITLDGTTGLSFSVGDGTADAAMTFSGTITNINNALSGMSVTAGSTGDRTLSITAANMTGVNSVYVAVRFGAVTANTVAPAISGSNDYGNVLTCSDGTWTGYPAPTITKQWQKNGTNISGQTGNTYTSTFADVGATITCEVTGTNAYNAVTVEPSGTLIRDPDGLNITDLTVAWGGLTGATVGYVSGEIIANDWLDFQIDKVTTFDSGDLEETSELLDAGEISGGAFEVVLPTLAEDTWYIRVRVRRGAQVSAWSAYDTYSSAWSPLDQGADLLAWYDASDIASITKDGSNIVSQWNDLSGAGEHLTASTYSPTYQATGFNTSYPTMSFGADQFMVNTSFAGTSGAVLTVVVVGQYGSGSDANARLVAYSAGSGQDYDADGLVLGRNGGASGLFVYKGATLGTQTYTFDTPSRFMAVLDGANCTVYRDNTAGTPVAHSTNFGGAGYLYVGGGGAVGIGGQLSSISGKISEVIVFKSAPDSTLRTAIDDYLKAKWGLA